MIQEERFGKLCCITEIWIRVKPYQDQKLSLVSLGRWDRCVQDQLSDQISTNEETMMRTSLTSGDMPTLKFLDFMRGPSS